MSEKKDNDKYWITVLSTVNLGNYESVKVEAGYSKSYAKGNAKDLIEADTEELAAIVIKKTKAIKKKLKK